MGGCRCTYRNCNVKSDGKTHMFHYPVFDKVRCHQWLVNAQRLEFLDLKVSQLKNRCVCQHHFKEENFMNYKKDKLTFDAVPTENGPFCDPSKFERLGNPKDYPIPILVEDIENDFDVNDKKSNFSVKYGDFLTNNEFVDSSARYNRNNIILTKDNTGINLNSSSYIKSKDNTLTAPQNTRFSLSTGKKINVAAQPMLVVPPYSDLSNELKMGKELNLEQNVIHSHTNLVLQDQNSSPENICVIASVQSANIPPNLNSCVKRGSKVKILSEKKIEDPIDIGHILGKFEIISPSRTLTLPDKSYVLQKVEKEPEIAPSTVKYDNKPYDSLKLEVLDVEFDPVQKNDGQVENDQNKTFTDKIEKIMPQSPPKKVTQIKNKVTPERSAAIEKKRKFNMKLKDIIATCLDKLDDPEKNYEISSNITNNFEKPPNNSLNEDIMTPEKRKISQPEEKVVIHRAEDKKLPIVQDNTIAYLEERMKQMESTLLNKIAQNSQQIIDFKNSWTKDSSQVGMKRKERGTKRFVSTQTNESESCYKKFLYQEISKYLSPSSNSQIYEELFINKYSCEELKRPLLRKRRKCI